jgi:Flp pilus assembly protein CpaB
MTMNNSRVLLTIIAVVLIGIFVVVAMQFQQDNRSPVEKIGDGISETAEEIGDEIDDNTDAR